jgi:hypothetical protein
MKYIILYLKGFLIYEKKELRKKYDLIVYFYENINLSEYIKFLFDRDNFNPIKIQQFKEYINKVKKKKLFSLKNKKENLSKNKILVETFINHPAYTLSNVIIAKYLQKFIGGQLVGVIRKNDIKSEVLFRAFGMKSFVYFCGPNFIQRIYYLLKAVKINYELNEFKKSINFKYKKIDVGLTSYDTYIRYLGKPTINKLDANFLIYFAECLYAADFFQKKLFTYKNQKTSLIQSETQFFPLNTLFQICLKNKAEVFSRSGLEEFTIRHYNNWQQRYLNRGSFSQKLFDYVYSKYKKKSLASFKKLYQGKIRNRLFGIDEVILGLNKRNKIFISKSQFKKKKKLDSRPIAIFFLSHLLDGNFNYGYRKNFRDIYTSTKYLIDEISKNDQFNWVIKKHPNQDYFKAKKDFTSIIQDLIKKKNNITIFDEKYDSSSLLHIADIAFTVSGSVGVEYPSFGINTFFYEKSYYSNLDFFKIEKPKDIKKILKLKNSKKKITKQFIEKCRTYLFIKDVLAKSKSGLIPSYIPSRKLDEKIFWKNSKYLLENYAQSEDNFYSMFNSQLKLKMRHTINLDLIKNNDLIFSDFND